MTDARLLKKRARRADRAARRAFKRGAGRHTRWSEAGYWRNRPVFASSAIYGKFAYQPRSSFG